MNPFKRHQARRYALQALYQWQLSQDNLQEIELQFVNNNNMKKVDTEYFHELLHEIPAQLDAVDASYAEFLDRSVGSLNPIELAILRIGSYELVKHPEIPYRVVINEAIELAKVFGATDGHKYVNGVLDKLRAKVLAEG